MFKDKRILITGITGFIGQHVAAKLRDLGADVYGVSSSSGSAKILEADITHYTNLEAFFQQKKIEMCIHLAGVALVEEGQKDPYHTFKSNIVGTLNILEIARTLNLEKVIITSTSHVYGDNDPPYKEEYSPRPSRPYETSKTCNDLIAQSYADTFHLPVLIPRFVNIYGPGDKNMSRLIPHTMQRVIADEPPEIWGGNSERSYLYINDAVDAYIQLLQLNMKEIEKNRIYNFGSDDLISVNDLTKKIIELSGKDLQIAKNTVQREQEVSKQYVSWSKAKRVLGWQPQVSLEEGLQKTLEWYKKGSHD